MPIINPNKRPIEEIVKTIEDHPTMTYEELRGQARQIGILAEDFDTAWALVQQKPQRLPPKFRLPFYYGCALLISAAAGITTTVWFPQYGPTNEGLRVMIQYASYFFLSILITHLASRFAGGRGNLFTTTRILLVLTGLGYLVSLVAATGGIAVAFAGFLGALALLVVLYVVSQTYDLGLIRLFVFLSLDIIFSAVVFFSILGIKLGLI